MFATRKAPGLETGTTFIPLYGINVNDTAAPEARETLYITDAELIRRMGVPEKIAREALRMLDAKPNSGFPKKQKLWGDRRYWPAVRAYFDETNKLNCRIDAARSAAENRVPHSAAASPILRRSQRRDMQ